MCAVENKIEIDVPVTVRRKKKTEQRLFKQTFSQNYSCFSVHICGHDVS